MKMFDPYQVLGVSRNVDEKTLKSTYRRLTLKHHPDKNPETRDDSTFKDIVKAYNILNDQQLREQFDRTGNVGEIDESRFGNNRFSCFDGLFYDMDDIIDPGVDKNKRTSIHLSPDGSPTSPSAEDPGSRTRVVSENQYTLKLNMKELMSGCVKTIWINNRVVCPNCRGDGQINTSRGVCTLCFGGDTNCPNCKGSFESFMASSIGNSVTSCKECDGRGVVLNKLKQKIRIPAGIDDHFTTHIEAKNGPPILVQCISEMPPAFARRGCDLCYSMNVTYVEVLSGAKRKLLLPDGAESVIHIPGVIKAGVMWRIPGRGIPYNKTRGDMVINIIIKWPKHALTPQDWDKHRAMVPEEVINAKNVECVTSQQKELWASVIKSFI
jgi:molecular chaperone DnaJ